MKRAVHIGMNCQRATRLRALLRGFPEAESSRKAGLLPSSIGRPPIADDEEELASFPCEVVGLGFPCTALDAVEVIAG
jgi:hypothetical protein